MCSGLAEKKNICIGILLSAGGSAFAEAAHIATGMPIDFVALTDRPCGAEERCSELKVEVARIEEPDNQRFSQAARNELSHCDLVLLFFSRLVTADLFEPLPCYNIHPSFLPAFPGMGAVKRAWAASATQLGATLHRVDASMDGGPIVAQTAVNIPPNADLRWCERASFLQKVFLTLHFFELAIQGDVQKKMSEPFLSNPTLVHGFRTLQSAYNMTVLI